MTIKEINFDLIAPEAAHLNGTLKSDGIMEDVEEMEVEEVQEKSKSKKSSSLSEQDFINLLEEDSKHLLKRFIEGHKEICKFLVFSESTEESSSLTATKQNLLEKVKSACEKYRRSSSSSKVAKLFSKLFPEDNGKLSCESNFFKTLLKYGMNSGGNEEGGPVIVGILQCIVELGASAGTMEQPTLGIQMIVSHSSAADIFLESNQLKEKPVQNNKSKQENFKKFAVEEVKYKYSEIKTQLLKLWKNLVIAFTRVSKSVGTPNDKKILENSVPYLFQMYSATMSEPDREILQIIQEYAGRRLQISIESMPLFGPKSLEPAVVNSKVSNPLFAHSTRANQVLGLINERQAFRTAMEWRENYSPEDKFCRHYDFKFLLPLICHVLDSRNVCDAVKVITHGWIYLIVRGMSFEDSVLRNLSFLAYKQLVQHFQLPKKGFKMQDIKVWLHFLMSVRKGVQNLGKCKVSNLLSVWMVATWEGIRQPAHPMYQRLTTLLFAKPVIDLGVLPDFLPFYNAVDGNMATREWILKILSHGLQTRQDWQIAQKLPTITSLCSSFLVETVFIQRDILRILIQGAQLSEVAQEMVDRHSLLIWITNINVSKRHTFGRELYQLFTILRKNTPDNECRQLLFNHVANVHDWTY